MTKVIADVAVLALSAVGLGAAVHSAIFLFELGYNVF